jgi:hypothetical protein
MSLKGGSGSLLWNGTTLTINGGGAFSGNISAATGTFTGGVSGTGYTLNNSGLNLTNASSVISVGGVTLSNSGLAGTGFSLTAAGGVVASQGTVGGWVINSNNLSSPPVNSISRLVLAASSLIKISDSDGVGRLFIRSGPLTTPSDTASSVSATFVSVSTPDAGIQTNYDNTTIYGNYTQFIVPTAGSYTGAITLGPYHSGAVIAVMSGPEWTGYVSISLLYEIASDTAFNNVIAQGTITSRGVGSYSENGSITQIELPSGTASINVSLAAATYYSRLRWTVNLNSETAQITIYSRSSGATNVTLSMTNTFAEFTDEGLQIANSGVTYFRIQRDSLQGSNNAYVKIGGALEVTGDIVSLASDRRLKENIIPIDGALDKIDKINGVYFNYTDNAKEVNPHFSNGRQVGLIAQEVQEVLPEVVNFAPFDYGVDNKNISGENYLTLNYDKVVPLLLQAIKELKCELDVVKKLIK